MPTLSKKSAVSWRRIYLLPIGTTGGFCDGGGNLTRCQNRHQPPRIAGGLVLPNRPTRKPPPSRGDRQEPQVFPLRCAAGSFCLLCPFAVAVQHRQLRQGPSYGRVVKLVRLRAFHFCEANLSRMGYQPGSTGQDRRPNVAIGNAIRKPLPACVARCEGSHDLKRGRGLCCVYRLKRRERQLVGGYGCGHVTVSQSER